MRRSSGQSEEDGFAGVQNFPTVGLIDRVTAKPGRYGMGSTTGDRIAVAPTSYVDDAYVSTGTCGGDDRSRRRHHRVPQGLPRAGIRADTALTLDDCVELIDRCAAAARSVRPDVIVLCHGGPIANPDDSAYVLQRARDIHGFYGASSMERLPTEQALKAQTEAFKAVTF